MKMSCDKQIYYLISPCMFTLTKIQTAAEKGGSKLAVHRMRRVSGLKSRTKPKHNLQSA